MGTGWGAAGRALARSLYLHTGGGGGGAPGGCIAVLSQPIPASCLAALNFLPCPLASAPGGNSKTSLVACVSPSEESAQETFGTLAFAAGAKKICNRVGAAGA